MFTWSFVAIAQVYVNPYTRSDGTKSKDTIGARQTVTRTTITAIQGIRIPIPAKKQRGTLTRICSITIRQLSRRSRWIRFRPLQWLKRRARQRYVIARWFGAAKLLAARRQIY
jgi:hypothetical protein